MRCLSEAAVPQTCGGDQEGRGLSDRRVCKIITADRKPHYAGFQGDRIAGGKSFPGVSRAWMSPLRGGQCPIQAHCRIASNPKMVPITADAGQTVIASTRPPNYFRQMLPPHVAAARKTGKLKSAFINVSFSYSSNIRTRSISDGHARKN